MSFHDWGSVLSAPGRRRSRSINAENPTGEPGRAATAASALGPGRKGRPAISLAAGETATLADITGPGIIQHIWMTVPDRTDAGPWVLRDLVLRIWWDEGDDGEQAGDPAVEVPLGDFFCNGFGQRALVTSAAVVVAPTGGFNCYFPMPFGRRARIELSNDHPGPVDGIYYQIDYCLDEDLDPDSSRFHAHWRRSNGTTGLGEDHIILDGVNGSGQYVGSYIGVTALERYWWGEGEVKFFIDSDGDHPTQCSTGLEDYAGGAWAFQDALRTDPPPKPITFQCAVLRLPVLLRPGHHRRVPVRDQRGPDARDVPLAPAGPGDLPPTADRDRSADRRLAARPVRALRRRLQCRLLVSATGSAEHASATAVAGATAAALMSGSDISR